MRYAHEGRCQGDEVSQHDDVNFVSATKSHVESDRKHRPSERRVALYGVAAMKIALHANVEPNLDSAKSHEFCLEPTHPQHALRGCCASPTPCFWCSA